MWAPFNGRVQGGRRVRLRAEVAMDESSYVFISHSSHDHSLAEMLCSGLEYEGIRCWIAPRDIPPGMHYGEGILQGIDDCSVFLILFSESADASPHVCNEVEDAVGKGKSLLLVRTDSADPRNNRQLSLFFAQPSVV
jgi:TIR domain